MKARNVEAKGIKSIEIGCAILEKIASFDQPLSITEIARECGMSASKAHHYIVSLCRVGFLQKEADGRYGISLKLSLLGLRETNQAALRKIVEPQIKEFAVYLNETVAFSIWGDQGPVVLVQERSVKSIYNLGVQEGSTMKLTSSANGKVFAAFYDSHKTKKLLEQEIREDRIDADELENELRTIREQGYALTEGGYVPGFNVVAVPVFNQVGQMIGVLSVIGISGILDLSPDSLIMQYTLHKARELSKLFGH